MDIQPLFKISHGLYIIGATELNGRLVGSCIDSVMVVESNPPQIIVSLGKISYTAEQILKTKRFFLSVLGKENPYPLIERFGFHTSRKMEKWANIPHTLVNGLPALSDSIAGIEVNVLDMKETKTHYVFLCAVENLFPGSMKEPITYGEYQNHIQSKSNKERRTTMNKKYICTVCGYIYDEAVEGIPFTDLPEDYVCPVCGEPKSAFEEMTD